MKSEKVEFLNQKEEKIAAILDWPINKKPLATAIFAHCFTCNKNFKALKNISRGLTNAGFAVLRFDFTGLGESEGEFAESNFDTNIEDIELAAKFLEEKIEAPKLLIGHSLGGTAVLFSAHKIKSTKGIVTIGSPYHPSHATKLFDESIEEIKKKGRARVNIGGRPFTVSSDLISTLEQSSPEEILADLKKSLLIMHSPQDDIVSIDNAEKIYIAARHPKSFITLGGADHLMSHAADSSYVGKVIGSWIERYIKIEDSKSLKTNHQVAAQTNHDSLTTDVYAEGHALTADEPERVGGNNLGPSPYGFLSSALASCTSLTLQMYAKRKNWSLETATVHINHKKDYVEDSKSLEDKKGGKIDHFYREIELKGDLSEDQKERLLEIADKCPIHKTLHSEIMVETKLLK